MNGWKVAAEVVAFIIAGGLYEVWGVWMEGRHPGRAFSITGLTKRYTHAMIIVLVFAGIVFGYVLRSGGP